MVRRAKSVLMGAAIVGPLVATGYAGYLVWNRLAGWADIALLVGLYIPAALGITVGYHRCVTHGSFETNRAIKLLLVILGCAGMQGGPISWAANHRLHHAFADREGDLHSPHLARNAVVGFLHSHVGWLLLARRADPNKWARDLSADRDLVFVARTAPVWAALSLLIPFLISGWSGLLWGGLVRVFLVHHVTWSVNSVCHVFGQRPFKTRDLSRNHWLVGLVGFGEGGHNTHHASPRSARHGLKWYHFDLSWGVIRLLGKARMAWNIYTLDPDDLPAAIGSGASGVKVVTLWPRREPLRPPGVQFGM